MLANIGKIRARKACGWILTAVLHGAESLWLEDAREFYDELPKWQVGLVSCYI